MTKMKRRESRQEGKKHQRNVDKRTNVMVISTIKDHMSHLSWQGWALLGPPVMTPPAVGHSPLPGLARTSHRRPPQSPTEPAHQRKHQ